MTVPGPPERRDVLRASDADRERIVELLRTAMAEGRLSQAELLQRTDAAYAARTYADLDTLIADLPPRAVGQTRRLPAAAPGPTTPPARRDRSPGVRADWAVWGTAVAVNVMIWFLVSVTSTDPVYFWPMWVAGPWAAVLIVRALAQRANRP